LEIGPFLIDHFLVVHDAENVAVRIFEQGDLEIAGDMYVALASRAVPDARATALRLETGPDSA
jgi:hypothetical protein